MSVGESGAITPENVSTVSMNDPDTGSLEVIVESSTQDDVIKNNIYSFVLQFLPILMLLLLLLTDVGISYEEFWESLLMILIVDLASELSLENRKEKSWGAVIQLLFFAMFYLMEKTNLLSEGTIKIVIYYVLGISVSLYRVIKKVLVFWRE